MASSGTRPRPALLRLSFLVAAALYNYTEASFYGLNNMWVLMLAASIDPAGAVTASSRVLDRDIPARPSRVGRETSDACGPLLAAKGVVPRALVMPDHMCRGTDGSG